MRHCLVCDAPVLTRGSAKFCSDACRVTHFRRRARLRERLAARPRCAVCRKPLAIGLRTNARFCSAACRQAAYRSRRAAKAAKPKKAHQRVIKDRLATVADQVRASLDIRSAIVRKICSRREERDHHAAEEMRNFLDRRAPWARSTCTARRVLVCAERQNECCRSTAFRRHDGILGALCPNRRSEMAGACISGLPMAPQAIPTSSLGMRSQLARRL